MTRVVQELRTFPAVTALCGLMTTLAAGAAWAAPPGAAAARAPLNHVPVALARGALAESGPGHAASGLAARSTPRSPPPSAGAASRAGVEARSLDLSVPDDWPSRAARPTQRPGAIDLRDPDYREELPALGPDMPRPEPSRIEALALKVHREGVPLARLWQNKNALLSLGLSPRGKPGLWLIQKVH